MFFFDEPHVAAMLGRAGGAAMVGDQLAAFDGAGYKVAIHAKALGCLVGCHAGQVLQKSHALSFEHDPGFSPGKSCGFQSKLDPGSR